MSQPTGPSPAHDGIRLGHVVDEFGEAREVCLDCMERDKRLTAAWAKITELRNELAGEHADEPVAADVREVLEYWRPLCMPKAKIVAKSERWMKVRARLTEKDVNTRKPAYTVLALKAAVLGALMSENHVENGWLDAVTIFRDSTTVDKHLARAVRFKERQGVSALELVDKFFSARLAWLADRCSCERLRIDHLMGEVDHAFDEFHAGLERFMRDGKPSAVQAPEWVLHG